MSNAYRAESRKLQAQLSTRLLALVCLLGPFAFAAVLSGQSASPADTLFGVWVHSSGFALPLVVLGGRGLFEAILPRLRSARASALIPFSYVAFASIGSAFLVLAPLAVAGQPQYTMTVAAYDGLTWLGGQPAGRVLSMPGVGLYIPAYSPDTVYVGHYDETFDYASKTQIALNVLTGKTDLEQFIQANHIRFVVWTSDLPTPPPALLGAPSYDTPNFKIWKEY